ncbi:MAG: hypothetical protein MJ252_22375, partial [archaeon]|nr:hypothetical protein [archaeon]
QNFLITADRKYKIFNKSSGKHDFSIFRTTGQVPKKTKAVLVLCELLLRHKVLKGRHISKYLFKTPIKFFFL